MVLLLHAQRVACQRSDLFESRKPEAHRCLAITLTHTNLFKMANNTTHQSTSGKAGSRPSMPTVCVITNAEVIPLKLLPLLG